MTRSAAQDLRAEPVSGRDGAQRNRKEQKRRRILEDDAELPQPERFSNALLVIRRFVVERIVVHAT